MGEKTAVKLISQFGSVDRLYENLTLVRRQAARDARHRPQAGAPVARAGACSARSAPLDVDLEAFRRVEPDWAEAARALDGDGVHAARQGAAGHDGRGQRRAGRSILIVAQALADCLAAGAGRARRWPSTGPGTRAADAAHRGARPLPSEAAGAAWTACGAGGGLRRPLADRPRRQAACSSGGWSTRRTALPRVEDTALAAYLLNPARATYKLDEVCMEAFMECPPALPAPPAAGKTDAPPATSGDALGRSSAIARAGSRGTGSTRAAELDARALRRIYDDIERPLVPVLAAMERHGIRVEPAPPRGVRQGAGARSRQPHPRDLCAGRRGRSRSPRPSSWPRSCSRS